MFIEYPYAQIEFSNQTLIAEVHSVELEKDELQSQQETHAYGTFVTLSQFSLL